MNEFDKPGQKYADWKAPTGTEEDKILAKTGGMIADDPNLSEQNAHRYAAEEVKKEIIHNATENEDQSANIQRLRKAAETLSADDFLYFNKILGNPEGKTEQLFDLRGKALHTTNDFYFRKMLDSGIIKTDNNKEGMYSSPGASFTDGDFSEAATFQTIYDDQNTHSTDKRFNSQNYDDKTRAFVRYFWEKNPAEFSAYLSKISGGKKVEIFEDALVVAEGFKFKARPKEMEGDPETLSKLFGITIVYDKKKLPGLGRKKQDEQTSEFELLSFREGGVPISEASAIFVPESQIENMRQTLQEYGLSHIEIRPSEELEIVRTVKLLDKK